MGEQDAFSGCHPAVNGLYFALVLGFSMFLMHPVCIALSLICAISYSLRLNGRRALRFQLAAALPMMVLAAALNVLFNHRGDTVLAYLPTGNPLTLESLLYGVAAAGMLWAVVSWFSCWNRVMTADKFVYLFGRVIPAISLVLTMVFRFVPRFKAQFRAVSQAQQCLGRSMTQGKVLQRLSSGAAILSIMLTWSLENAVDTADSMKSRGYGLPGRSAFSIYRFDRRDSAVALWLGIWGALILWGVAAGGLPWRFFPRLSLGAATPLTAGLLAAYGALCLTPLLLDLGANARWRRSRGEGWI